MFSGNQSVLNPHGPVATALAGLSWYLIAVLGIAYVATMILLFVAILRARRGRALSDRSSWRITVGWGLAVPLVVLTSILIYSISAGSIMAAKLPTDALVVHVVGKQFWWQVQYLKHGVVIGNTANEIHVPVGTPVKIKLSSTDVIHSFWVPNLTGKVDLIPGRTNETWLGVDSPGVWRGQCAEFCGSQHAHMSLEIVAEAPEKFSEWLAWQAQPALRPDAPSAVQGREVFLSQPCVMCHTIRGTLASATAGPDLTHVAGRRTIAAATRTNIPEHLGGWISNAQAIKPGTKMPRMSLASGQVDALVAYLGTLQ
jgi:cytochrome c oxidase subunit II